MIPPGTRDAVLRRDGWLCQLMSDKCTTYASQVAHVLFHDREGKHDSKAVRDWVDEEWNLTASCTICNVIERADKGPKAREKYIAWMMHKDQDGFLKWYKRKPAKLQDAEVRLIVARAVADSYNRASNKQVGGAAEIDADDMNSLVKTNR